MTKISQLVIGLMLFSFFNIAQADVMSIADPRAQVPNSSEGVLRPTRGMSMAEVEQKFGAPEQKFSAVGEPPISRWVYNGFSVFFEHSWVIHSVVQH
jgi:hypothetical protein